MLISAAQFGFMPKSKWQWLIVLENYVLWIILDFATEKKKLYGWFGKLAPRLDFYIAVVNIKLYSTHLRYPQISLTDA